MRLLLLIAGISAVGAQLLTKGNTQLPSCGQSCPLLNQAVEACSGTGDVNLGTWSCFCQSGYLPTLYQSATGICDSTCTNPNDLQQVSTWYNTECGTDFGQSQHANSAGGSSQASETSTGAGVATSGAALPTTTSSGGFTASTEQTQQGSWWSGHWQWIVMLIAILIGLLLFAALLIWFKRRMARKRDSAPLGFNTGITDRTVPKDHPDNNFAPDSTRDSYAAPVGAVPYIYGNSQNNSRVGSQTNVSAPGFRRAPVSRSETPIRDVEKGMADDEIRAIPMVNETQNMRRVPVREQIIDEKR